MLVVSVMICLRIKSVRHSHMYKHISICLHMCMYIIYVNKLRRLPLAASSLVDRADAHAEQPENEPLNRPAE